MNGASERESWAEEWGTVSTINLNQIGTIHNIDSS